MEHLKLLIIGAGASGIAAAARLLESGFTHFKILEAESRLGGRVNTTTIGNTPVELGAEWIHGEKDNAVFELASKYDLADCSNTGSEFINTNFFEFSGNEVNKDISVTLTHTYYDIMKTDGQDLGSEVLNGSVGSYFDAEFQKRIAELRKKFNIDESLCKKFSKNFENWENSIDASHSWYETSLCGHLEYWECEGNGLTLWKNKRYDTLFSLLTKKIPNPKEQLPVESRILFDKEVVKVKWNKECKVNEPNVEVECLDGTVYQADNILLTCSLGVLKERAPEMFSPSLPDGKLKCIKNLGFGTVDKIFIKFPYVWWKGEFAGCGFLWSEEERKSDATGWLNGVICFHPINPTSTIMRGWVTAEAAQQMEMLSNKEVHEGLCYLFDKFLSSYEVPPIEVCLTSKWYSNPHFRGSYSCRLMQSEASNVWACQLAEPVCNIRGAPILLFGGEATHDHYFSTVHGAIEAGWREAGRLLDMAPNGPEMPQSCQVAIVGAGISGLAAAKTLMENGVSDVVMLEAQEEPGGRIRSVLLGDYWLELGAQWIHGDKNEVFRICQENDLVTDEYSSEGEGIYYRENGDKISEDIIREVDDVVKDILENCENYILWKSKKGVPRSIGEELLIKFNEYLQNCTQDTEETREIKKELFGWHIRYQLIDNSCSDLFNLSARAWGLFKFCGGNDYVNFKDGYSSLVSTLVHGLPKNMIFCGTPVERVDWTEEEYYRSTENHIKQVKITCRNGQTLFSQYVIVTSSLGYLKREHKTLFSPPLPNYLSEAIESLDFGVIDKIFLIYNKPWWDANVKGFQLVWSHQEPEGKANWGRYVTGFDVIIKDKPVLLGWVGGEGAKIVEQMSEERVGREATDLLKKFTKIQDIPVPDRVIRTKWWSNEYVRGAYSHITVDCDGSDISGSNLAQPVYSVIHAPTGTYKKPVILLAGESTHQNHFSTVHGAYESGQSQAKVILDHIQRQNK